MYRLPPLNALRVFEAVARLGSVRRAAEELCVTPPAVSHQIAKLEEHLGQALFTRSGRNLLMTETACNYLTEIRPTLQAISRATLVASKDNTRETLTISAPPTLTSKWLLPRLTQFFELFPEYDVRLVDRMTLDLEEQSIDVAIEYRFEEITHFSTQQLFDDQIVALASPAFVKQHNLSAVEQLKGLTLIETERRLNSWRSLLAQYSWVNQQRYLSVGYSLQAFDAAELGLGIALGNLINAQDMIASEKLCIPFEIDKESIPPLPHYYLSIPPYKERWSRVSNFVDWVTSLSISKTDC